MLRTAVALGQLPDSIRKISMSRQWYKSSLPTYLSEFLLPSRKYEDIAILSLRNPNCHTALSVPCRTERSGRSDCLETRKGNQEVLEGCEPSIHTVYRALLIHRVRGAYQTFRYAKYIRIVTSRDDHAL